jgi:hypothetical protein
MKPLGKTPRAIPYTTAAVNGAPELVNESLLTKELDESACETFWRGGR